MIEEIEAKCERCGSTEWNLIVNKQHGIAGGYSSCAKCSNAQYDICIKDTDLAILEDDPGIFTEEYRRQLEASYVKMFSQ